MKTGHKGKNIQTTHVLVIKSLISRPVPLSFRCVSLVSTFKNILIKS